MRVCLFLIVPLLPLLPSQSNASLVKIENLAPNRRYNVTATMLTSEYEYYYVEKHQYRTLPHDYMPGIVTDIVVERFETNARDSRLVDAVISWTPAKGMYSWAHSRCRHPNSAFHGFPFFDL